MKGVNPCSTARRKLSNVARLATESLGVVAFALGVSALTTVFMRLFLFFLCLLRATPNEIFDLIVCAVAVIFRWGVIRTTPNEIFDLIVCFVAVISR